MFRFWKSPPETTARTVAAAIAGAGLLGLLSTQVLSHDDTRDAQSSNTPASTLKASGDTKKIAQDSQWQNTNSPHVQVRFAPSNKQKEGKGSAWVYVRPGTNRPASIAGSGVRRPTAIKSETLPGGGTIVHLDRGLMSASVARRDSKNRLSVDCVQNHDHSTHTESTSE